MISNSLYILNRNRQKLTHAMYYLICIEHMNRERIIAKIHEIPQIHHSLLMLRNLQQPLRTILLILLSYYLINYLTNYSISSFRMCYILCYPFHFRHSINWTATISYCLECFKIINIIANITNVL